MLKELSIRNFALIDSMTMEFSPRLNVLTGETGAGKSILIDALRFVLGERFDGTQASETVSVEALFELSPAFFKQHEVLTSFQEEGETQLILRREWSASKSRA